MQPLVDRFWAKVSKTDRCWNWTAPTTPKGYGQIQYWRDGKACMGRAHRISWELHNGPIPSGLSVLHRCDNPRCVRPEHLYLGTASDNARDAIARGRFTTGERNGCSVLSSAQVAEIKYWIGIGRCLTAIAESYGVQRSAISSIRRGLERASLNRC